MRTRVARRPGRHVPLGAVWIPMRDYLPPETPLEKVLAAASGELAFRDAWAAVEDMAVGSLRRGLVEVLRFYRDGNDERARYLLGLLLDRHGTIKRVKPPGRRRRKDAAPPPVSRDREGSGAAASV